MAWEKWQRFTHLFRPQHDTFVGVDFGNRTVKLAEVNLAGGKPYLKNFAVTDMAAAEKAVAEADEQQGLAVDTDTLTKQLQRALAMSGVKSKNAVIAMGGQAVFVREVMFPNLAPNELAMAIKWEIPKYVPYESDSYEFDYAITGHDAQSGELRVLVAAAPKQIINQLITVVRAAGLTPTAIDIEPLALYRAIPGLDNSLIVDMGLIYTQIALFQAGKPVAARVLQSGSTELSAALQNKSELQQENNVGLDELIDELAQEVWRISNFVNLQNKKVSIDKVVVTGTSEYELLAQLLKTKTDLPITGFNPLSVMTVSPSISAAYVKQMGPQLAVAIGLAMRGNEP